jgi:hypothetical protein
MSCGYDFCKGCCAVAGRLFCNELNVVLVQSSPFRQWFRFPLRMLVAPCAQVRKLTDVSHESICFLGVVPRIWIEIVADLVVDIFVIPFRIFPLCTELFGIALVKIKVVLHPFQRMLEASFSCFSEVLVESVAFSFAI